MAEGLQFTINGRIGFPGILSIFAVLLNLKRSNIINALESESSLEGLKGMLNSGKRCRTEFRTLVIYELVGEIIEEGETS